MRSRHVAERGGLVVGSNGQGDTMVDVFTCYENALSQLLEQLGRDHPRLAEVELLRGRLLENIAQTRQHGDTEARRAERSEIRGGLDRLARETPELDASFTDLVFSPAPTDEAGAAAAAMAERVFLAYSHEDQGFAHKLAANLRDAGVPVWVDRWDIQPGENWSQAINDAVYDCGQFLIVLSPAAVASADVQAELAVALDEKKAIVPVLYQECRIPYRVRLIQYVDYTARGPDDEAALSQLLRALGVERAARAAEREEQELEAIRRDREIMEEYWSGDDYRVELQKERREKSGDY